MRTSIPFIALVVAACGGSAAAPAAPIANVASSTAPLGGDIGVYVVLNGELVGLYCLRDGVLRGDGCAWADAIALPGDPPQELRGRPRQRVLMDESTDVVQSYGDPRAAVLVVEHGGRVSVWETPRDTSLRPAVDDAEVAIAAPAWGVGSLVEGDRTSAVLVEQDGVEREHLVLSYTTPMVYAVLDLDGDGDLEVIYRATDDGDAFVEVYELTDEGAPEEPFRARR